MPSEQSATRRDFLTGQAVRSRLRAGLPADVQVDVASNGYLLTVSRRAMACTFTVHLNATAGAEAIEAALSALDTVEAVEDQMTVYRETSEVVGINGRADTMPVPVEPRLFELLLLAQRIAGETHGAFDTTSGPLSRAWGFWRRQGCVPDEESLTAALDRVGSQHIVLDEGAKTIRFVKPGVEIQLNGIGKGYALDRAAEALDDAGVSDYLLHGGQSSVLARGNNGARPDGGWSVGIRHPLRSKEHLGEMILRDAALGTSGSATQSFYAKGRRWGHLLDPRTGLPAEGVLTSTVLASMAAEADALATALYVLGPDRAGEYQANRPEIAALLVCPGERAGEIRTEAFNLPPEVWHERAMRGSPGPAHLADCQSSWADEPPAKDLTT